MLGGGTCDDDALHDIRAFADLVLVVRWMVKYPVRHEKNPLAIGGKKKRFFVLSGTSLQYYDTLCNSEGERSCETPPASQVASSFCAAFCCRFEHKAATSV